MAKILGLNWILMKQKIEQLNQSYKKALGEVIQKKYPEQGIMIEDLLLDLSMRHGRVWLMCTPKQLEKIQEEKGEIQRLVQDHLKTRYTPIIKFMIADGYLDKIDGLFNKIEDED